MPTCTPDLERDPQHLKRQLGGYVRRGNVQAADATRRELAAVNLERHVRETVAKFGPLTDEQRDRLSLLLSDTLIPSTQDGDAA